MKSKKKVVIIGAGVGGITTALYLAQNGFAVEVHEKNASPGGRCGQLIQDGHRFDLGASILLMPSIYRTVFADLKLNLESDLETTELEPVYKLFFSDGTVFPYLRDTEKMKAQLEAIESQSSLKFMEYIDEGYGLFKLAMSGLLGRNFYSFFQFFSARNLYLLFQLKIWRKHTRYIKRFFRDERLQKAFTFQNIYVGQNPYKQPAFFSMLPSAEIVEGALFPKGGMHRIVQLLLTKSQELGVKYVFRSEVREILIDNNRVGGIRLAGKKVIAADMVIASADLPYVYQQLLPDKKVANRLKKKQYSCSAIVFHWALDKTYPLLDHHSIFLNEPYKEGMNYIFKQKSLSEHPSFYVHAPTRTDKTAAPEGQETLSVIIPVAEIDEKYNQNWPAIKQMARNSVIARLKEAGNDDIEEHIKFELCYMPKTFESYCNVMKGSVFGSLRHSIFQMGYFRPHNRHKRYRNLYFVGGSTHPGNGIPLVLLSAKLTSERILRNL